MPVSFPATDIDPRVIVKGAGKVYPAAYVASGADGTAIFAGATKGGVEISYARTMHSVESDQYLADVTAFSTKEVVTIKSSFLQLNLATLYLLTGTSDQTLVNGTVTDTSSSLTYGQSLTTRYYQLLAKMEAPPGATNSQRVYQFWKAFVTAIGPAKLMKTGEYVQEVTWMALADVTAVAAGKAPLFQILDS